MNDQAMENKTHKTSPSLDKGEATSSSSWVFRVLDGPQKGAETFLTSGRYSVGSKDDCRIILNGKKVIHHHLDFVIVDNIFSILQALGPVTIDERILDSFPIDIKPNTVIYIGDVPITYSIEGSEWLSLDSTRSHEGDLPKSLAKDMQLKVDKSDKKNRTNKNYLPRIAILGLLFSLIVIAVNLTLEFDSTSHDMNNPQKNDGEELPNTLVKMLNQNKAYSNIKATKDNDGNWKLVGYVESIKDLNNLRISSRDVVTVISVTVMEQVRSSLETILNAYGANNSINYNIDTKGNDGGFDLKIQGIINASQNINIRKLYDTIQNDIPKAENITISLITSKQIKDGLVKLQKSHSGFSELKFNLLLSEKALSISGTLLQNYTDIWQKSLEKHKKNIPIDLSISDNVIYSPEFSAIATSILIGQSSVAEFIYPNGRQVRIIEGAKLPDGFRVMDIQKSTLILEYDGHKYPYKLPF